MQKQKTVTLRNPIKRGEQQITEIILRKPNVLALKGLNLLNVMQVDVDSAIKLLPRITKPTLTKADLEQLDVQDFTQLSLEMVALISGAEEEVIGEDEGKGETETHS